MSNGEDNNRSKDFYQVLGLDQECSSSELRNAYKKLAMRWHPDRCSASGNSKFVEESKKKFQAIQQAYSVLSDANKRFLYDVGAYGSDDDDDGMGDFLNEMAVMMSQMKPEENGEETIEQLQELFEELFQGDIDSSGTSCWATTSCPVSSGMAYVSSDQNSGKTKVEDSLGFDSHLHQFCLGSGGTSARFQEGERSKQRKSRRTRR